MTSGFTIDSVRDSIIEEKITATALAQDFYTRIRKEDPEIGAFLTLRKARAGSGWTDRSNGRGGPAFAAAGGSFRRH